YVWAMSLVSLGIGGAALTWAVIEFVRHEVSVYLALLSVSMVILGIVLFVMGVVLHQGNMIQRELWSIQRLMIKSAGAKGSSDLIPTPMRGGDSTGFEL
ncbi:MAG TPA: hypothetical protein VFU03_07880, partial [Gemmatimonadales bacterium]|nr:hypothetical protein [Gemmatimonadales bacterium]